MTACGNCHSDVPAGSPTCPRCGGEMPKGFFASLLGGIFGTRVSRGNISVGDEIAFDSPKGDRVKLRVSGIESFRKIVQVANEGETVGLLFAKPVFLDVLVRGTILERA